MKRIKRSIALLILVFSVNSYGQNASSNFCQENLLGKSFISDGQDHQAVIRNGKQVKFSVVFYPQFRYKVVVCSDDKHLPIEMTLTDSNGKVYFSNATKNYVREWEFQYSSAMKASVELKLTDATKIENIRLLIGYQLIQNP